MTTVGGRKELGNYSITRSVHSIVLVLESVSVDSIGGFVCLFLLFLFPLTIGVKLFLKYCTEMGSYTHPL